MKPLGLFVCVALLALAGVPGTAQPQNASETRQNGDLVTFWKTAVAASRAEGDGAREIASLRSLGEAYERLGRLDEGLETLELCLQRATALGVSEAGALASTGRLYSVLGDHRNALDHLERAAAMHRAEGDTASEIAARLSIAAEYTSLGTCKRRSTRTAS